MPSPRSQPRSELIAHIDGASRGNPGPAAFAVVLESAEGVPVPPLKGLVGKATNNFAEYQALLAVLEYTLKHNILRLKVRSDSELLVRQIQGHYKVKSADLKPLHERACQMIRSLQAFSIEHIPREQNRHADRLANQVLDATEKGTELQSAPTAAVMTSATYRQGMLQPHSQLSLSEGEEVELEIRRRKKPPASL